MDLNIVVGLGYCTRCELFEWGSTLRTWIFLSLQGSSVKDNTKW